MEKIGKGKTNDVTISTIPVEIKVITVGGKRLTLSVFNQIPDSDNFLLDMNEEERIQSYLGWVDRDFPFVLFTVDGVLLKCSLRAYKEENNWNWQGYQKKYKISYKKFYSFFSPFLNLKNQIYISI